VCLSKVTVQGLGAGKELRHGELARLALRVGEDDGALLGVHGQNVGQRRLAIALGDLDQHVLDGVGHGVVADEIDELGLAHPRASDLRHPAGHRGREQQNLRRLAALAQNELDILLEPARVSE